MDAKRDFSINPSHMYRLDNLQELLGLGRSAIRQLRRNRGLVVHKAGNRTFILGADIISAVTNGGASNAE